MNIGQHGSGVDCPKWKIIASITLALLFFSPIIYKALIDLHLLNG